MSFDEWLIARLRAHGAYDGAYDGAAGRAVYSAIQKFQRAEGLKETGQADQDTVDALRSAANGRDLPDRSGVTPLTPPSEPVWMREARRLMGIREVPGPKSNPIILGFAKKLGGWVEGFYKNDDTAWCGLFIGNLIAMTLPQELLPANPLGALQWSKLGRSLDRPSRGAIMTFTREGGGHVGLYVGEDATRYHILGGNQSNSVSIAPVEKKRLVATRWPKTGLDPVGGPVFLTAAGLQTSRNEA